MTTALTPMDRNQELALESRVFRFHQEHLKEITPEKCLVLDKRGETHLRSLLYEAGYLQEGETPVYRRLSVEKQTGRPVIDVFEFRDVLAKDKGFSYTSLSNQDEWDAYVEARGKRYAKNRNAGATWGGLLSGFFMGGFFGDAILAAMDHSHQWHLSAWWLVVPPIVVGAIGYGIGKAIKKSGEEELNKDITSFCERYAHRISTSPEAILKAFGYNLPEIASPE